MNNNNTGIHTAPARWPYWRSAALLLLIVVTALLQWWLYPRWYVKVDVPGWYQSAYQAQATGAYNCALGLLDKIHCETGNYQLSRFTEGWCYHQLGDLPTAVRKYRLAERHTPEYAQTYANLGYALKELQRYDEAATAFAQHLEREPSNAASRAALDECRQLAYTSATGATAQIVFLSPSSNWYYRQFTGIDTIHYLAIEGNRTCCYADCPVGCIEWLRRGTWSQNSSGIIRLSTGKSTNYAALWHYRGCAFLLMESSCHKLLKERDKVVNQIDINNKQGLENHWGWQPINRLEFAMATGRVSLLLGVFSDSGTLSLPLCLLIFLTQASFILLLALPIVAASVLWLVRPHTPCPVCGQSLAASALRGYYVVRCRHCKMKTKLTVPITWRVRIVMGISALALCLWCVLMILTASNIPTPLWFLLIFAVWLTGLAARNRLYARWLYARIADGG